MARAYGPRIVLCAQCRTIQRVGQACSICRFPIPKNKGTFPQGALHTGQYAGEKDEELEPPFSGKKKTQLSTRERVEINDRIMKAGLDGNGRFESPSKGLDTALDVLGEHGIELDDVPNSWALTKYEQFKLTLAVAWINEEDSFQPIPIHNSMLFFTWYKLADDVYECLAYLS